MQVESCGLSTRARAAAVAWPPALRHGALRVLSADAGLLGSLLSARQHGRVHSVFDRAINVELGGGRLMTLAARHADDAPDTIIVDLDAWADSCPAAGTEVVAEGHRIAFGNGGILLLDQARGWRGLLPPYRRDDRALRANVPAAQKHLARHGKGIAAGQRSTEATSCVDCSLRSAFERGVAGLCRALTVDDEGQARLHARQLIGLGPGLTPSGDDFLIGLLAALLIPGSPRQAPPHLGGWIVEVAAARTHPISAAALRHAAAGRVRASVVVLCDALMRGTTVTTLSALDQVLRIGSTSGSDIAAGVLAGFRLHLGGQPLSDVLV